MRTPPHIIPLTVPGIPTTLLGILNQFLPPRLADPGNALAQRITIGDVSAVGLPRPAEGLVASFPATGSVPIIDVGMVEQLRHRRVEPVPAATGFDEQSVHLADGTRLRVDVLTTAAASVWGSPSCTTVRMPTAARSRTSGNRTVPVSSSHCRP